MKEEMKVKNAEVRKEEFETKVEERKAKRERRRKEKEDKEEQEEVKPEDVVAGAAKEEERSKKRGSFLEECEERHRKMKREEERKEAKGIREALKRMIAEGEIEEPTEERIGKRSRGSKDDDVDVDEMRVDVRKGRGQEGMGSIKLAEVRVEQVIDGVRRIGRHDEEEAVEV